MTVFGSLVIYNKWSHTPSVLPYGKIKSDYSQYLTACMVVELPVNAIIACSKLDVHIAFPCLSQLVHYLSVQD